MQSQTHPEIDVRHETYTDNSIVPPLSGLKQWVGYINGKRATAGRTTKKEAFDAVRIELGISPLAPCDHETVITSDGHGAYCRHCGMCLA